MTIGTHNVALKEVFLARVLAPLQLSHSSTRMLLLLSTVLPFFLFQLGLSPDLCRRVEMAAATGNNVFSLPSTHAAHTSWSPLKTGFTCIATTLEKWSQYLFLTAKL
jgi:hypothetical protein